MHPRSPIVGPLSRRKRSSRGRLRRSRQRAGSFPYRDCAGGRPATPWTLPFVSNVKELCPPLANGEPPWLHRKELLGDSPRGPSGLLELRLCSGPAAEIAKIAGVNVPAGFLHVTLGKVLVKRAADVRRVENILNSFVRSLGPCQPSAGLLVPARLKLTDDGRMIIGEILGFNSARYLRLVRALRSSGVDVNVSIANFAPHVTLRKMGKGCRIPEGTLRQMREAFPEALRLQFQAVALTAPSKASAVILGNSIIRWRLACTRLPEVVSPAQKQRPQASLCRFFLRGRCTRGASCKFRHSKINEEELHPSPKEGATVSLP